MTSSDRKQLIAWLGRRSECTTMPGAKRMFKLALDAVREQENDPLTLEQLREMDGEPVWIEFFSKTSKTGKWDGWAIVDNRFETQEFMEMHHLKFSFYGKSWKAYRRPPERSENG